MDGHTARHSPAKPSAAKCAWERGEPWSPLVMRYTLPSVAARSCAWSEIGPDGGSGNCGSADGGAGAARNGRWFRSPRWATLPREVANLASEIRRFDVMRCRGLGAWRSWRFVSFEACSARLRALVWRSFVGVSDVEVRLPPSGAIPLCW